MAATTERGVPPGSLRYFAVLFAPARHRPLLGALYGVEAEIRAAGAIATHEVAHARLHWWRSEIDRLIAGQPTHPLTIQLMPLRGNANIGLNLLHELVVAADLDLAGLTYRNWDELEAYCYRAAGALQQLASRALSNSRPTPPEVGQFACGLGSALRQTEMLRDFALDLQRGRLYLPLEIIESAGIDPRQMADATASGAVVPVLASWRARVAAQLVSLPARLTDPALRASQRHGLVLAALHARLLEHTARVPLEAGSRAELGAFTRLWTAWRAAVRQG
jgi:phytoene synthase